MDMLTNFIELEARTTEVEFYNSIFEYDAIGINIDDCTSYPHIISSVVNGYNPLLKQFVMFGLPESVNNGGISNPIVFSMEASDNDTTGKKWSLSERSFLLLADGTYADISIICFVGLRYN